MMTSPTKPKILIVADLDNTHFDPSIEETSDTWIHSKEYWQNFYSEIDTKITEKNVEMVFAIVTSKNKFDDICQEAAREFKSYLKKHSDFMYNDFGCLIDCNDELSYYSLENTCQLKFYIPKNAFSHFVVISNFNKHKSILKIAKKHQISPENCILLDDNQTVIESAKKKNINVISFQCFCPWTNDISELKENNTYFTYRDENLKRIKIETFNLIDSLLIKLANTAQNKPMTFRLGGEPSNNEKKDDLTISSTNMLETIMKEEVFCGKYDNFRRLLKEEGYRSLNVPEYFYGGNLESKLLHFSQAIEGTRLEGVALGSISILFYTKHVPQLEKIMSVKSIKRIVLNGHLFDDNDAVKLGYAVKNHDIEELDLSSNCITDQGAINLILTQQNSKLKKLNLVFNKISGEGAKAIASQLQTTNIIELHIDFKCSELEKALELNREKQNSHLESTFLPLLELTSKKPKTQYNITDKLSELTLKNEIDTDSKAVDNKPIISPKLNQNNKKPQKWKKVKKRNRRHKNYFAK